MPWSWVADSGAVLTNDWSVRLPDIIQIDADAAALGRNAPARVSILAEAGRAVDALIASLPDAPARPDGGLAAAAASRAALNTVPAGFEAEFQLVRHCARRSRRKTLLAVDSMMFNL